MTSDKNTALLVCSMHRSGSSVLTRSFNILGYGVSDSQIGINKTNETGHWESRKVARLNDRLLEAYGSTWQNWQTLMNGAVSAGELGNFKIDIANTLRDDFNCEHDIVVKDPRICRFADLYLQCLDEMNFAPKVIGIFRNPLDVMSSLEKRNDMEPIQAGFLWLRYVLDAEFLTRGHPRAFVSYERFQSKPAKVISKILENLDLSPKFDFKTVKKEIKKTVDTKKSHHNSSPEEVILHPLTKSYIASAYAALRVLESDPNNSVAMKDLDKVRAQFDDNTELLETVLNLTTKASDKQLAELSQSLQDKESQIKEAERKILGLENTSSNLKNNMDLTTKASDRQLAELSQSLHDKESQLKEAERKIVGLENTSSNLKNKLTSSELELASADKMQEEYASQLGKTASDVAALRAKLDAAEASCAGLLKKAAQSEQNLTSAQDKNKELEVSFNSSVSEARELRNSLKNLQGKLKIAEEAKAETTAQNLSLNQKISSHLSELDVLNSKLELTRTHLEFMEKTKEQALLDAGKVSGRLEVVTSENKELKQYLSSRENSIGQLEEKLAQNVTESDALSDTVLKLQEKLEQKEGELSQLEGTLTQKGKSFIELSESVEAERLDFSNEKSALTVQVKKLQKKIRQAESSQLKIAENNEVLARSLKKAQKDYDKAVAQIRERDSSLKTQRQSIRNLQKQNWHLQDRLSIANDQLQEFLNSSSWKITRPMRVMKRFIARQPLRPTHASTPPQPRLAPLPAKANLKKSNHKTRQSTNKETLSDRDIILKFEGFDESYYLAHYPEVQVSDLSPLDHFLDVGWRKRYQPNEAFNVDAYIASHRELNPETTNPYIHYLRVLNSKALSAKYTAHQEDLARVGKIAIIGAISGNYDGLKEPLVKTPGADYFMFSDHEIAKGSLWKKRQFDFISSDPTRTARFIKTHPHLYFSNYDWVIWVDANLQINSDLRSLIAPQQDELDLITWHHPLRDCVYEEAAECAKRSKDDNDILKNQVKRYASAGLEKKSGLWETSVFVSKMGEPRVVDFMNSWWKQILQGSRRDQIGLPQALRESNVKIGSFAPHGICMRTDNRFNYYRHTPTS